MIEIREACDFHIRAVAKRLREADRREVQCLGFNPLGAAFDSYRSSLFSSVALIDGRPAAIWGVAGTFLDVVGRPWLLTTPECESVALSFALIYRREMRKMLKIFPRLENVVDASYYRAVRLLEIAGFKVDPAVPLGPNATPFRRYWLGDG